MIELVSEQNLKEVLPLIRMYQEFYKVDDISDDRNISFFSQFGNDSDKGCLFLYRLDNKVVGFATVYFSYSSTIASKVAILNDLFTLPETRGLGIGKKLVEFSREYALEMGASRLQWVTALDNDAAQKLYDSMPTNKSTWHFYTYNEQN